MKTKKEIGVLIVVTLVLTLVLSIIPGKDMTMIDGPLLHGFPFTSYSTGGLVAPDVSTFNLSFLGIIGNTILGLFMSYVLIILVSKKK